MNTLRSKTTRRTMLIMLAVGHFLAAGAHANEASGVDRHQSEPKETRSSARKPQIGRGMAPGDSFALRFAFKGAIKRLEKDESCRALFDDLILDGLQAMGSSRYRPAQSAGERAHCARGVAAYTAVGLSQIVVCEHFNTLHRRTKIAVLIHEALHNAGMSEAPVDPDGMTAEEISKMVEEACDLSL